MNLVQTIKFGITQQISNIRTLHELGSFDRRKTPIYLVVNTTTNTVFATIVPELYENSPYLFHRYADTGSMVDDVRVYTEHFMYELEYINIQSNVLDDTAAYV